ncbi:MAG: methylated-DNA--[protein]-cysteine S-methyltransferase [Desulfuromonadaceae bacterium]|nr:methylated-DNA--[protein]-cysteine S-methyltransferase [Desulfuromonadaceae bacterium]
MFCSNYMTSYGAGSVYATEQGVVKIEIPDLSCSEPMHHGVPQTLEPSKLTAHAAELLQRYFKGDCIDFADVPVVLDALPPFCHRVLEVVRNISYGEICSYGQVASLCGSPRAARAVGGALAANPIPVIIPCHRVVASDGRLTGFSAPGGENTKILLLKMEGVEFKGLLVDKKQLLMHRMPLL